MATHITTWYKVRKFLNDIHLWMGLTSGIVLIAVCLSGTIYVYNTELQEIASPHLHKVNGNFNASEKLSAARLMEIVKEKSGGDITGLTIPHDAKRTYQVNVRQADDKSRFGTTYYLNPYNGQIVGTSLEKSGTTEFMGYMFSLHRWLLLDKIEEPLFDGLENRKLGSYITGTATILFTLGVLTGLVIWFPKKIKSWRQGLKIKWGGSWKRTNHDLHNTLGFYSFILLFLMGITGPQWSFEWYRDGLRKVLGTYEAPMERGGQAAGRQETAKRPDRGNHNQEKKEEKTAMQLLPIEHYITEANTVLPYAGDYRISLPKSSKEAVQFSKTKIGFFAPSASDQVKLASQTAQIEEVNIFTDKPFNERITASTKAIHVGNVYGSFTKLLYFLACLIATSLPVTGTIIWLNKMKKKPAKRDRAKKSAMQTKQVIPAAS